MLITIDRSESPILVVRYRGAPSVADFEKYLVELGACYDARKPFGLVFDAIGAEAPSAGLRKLQADFIRQREHQIRAYNVGTAFIVDSMLQRGALTAILWLQPLPCPHYVCAEVSEGKRWVRGRLDAFKQPSA